MEDLYQITNVELYDEKGNEIASEDFSSKLIVGDRFYDTMELASNNTKKTILKQYLKNASNRELTDCEDGWIYFTISGLTLAVKTLILEPREVEKNEVM